jgi:hypothetical protein
MYLTPLAYSESEKGLPERRESGSTSVSQEVVKIEPVAQTGRKGWLSTPWHQAAVLVCSALVGVALLGLYSRFTGHGDAVSGEISHNCLHTPPCSGEDVCITTAATEYAFCGDIGYRYSVGAGEWEVSFDRSNTAGGGR